MNQQLLNRMNISNWTVALSVILASFVAFPKPVALGLSAGTLLMMVSWYVSTRLLVTILNGTREAKIISAVLLGFKFLIVLGVVWAAMKYVSLNTFALAGGIALMVMSFVISSAFWLRREGLA